MRRYGPNELEKVKRRTVLHMFLGEFKEVHTPTLVATAFSAVIGYHEMMMGGEFLESLADAITISAIVVMCAVTGLVQEYRTEKAVETLKRLAARRRGPQLAGVTIWVAIITTYS